jgi:hypothetical protein
MAKLAECGYSSLGPSFFDGTAPAETQAHRSDGQCQRFLLRHLLYPTTTCSTPMQGTRFRDSLLLPYCCQDPSSMIAVSSLFIGFAGKIREPTSGLEPLTCSLRVIGQALQGFAQACKSPIARGVSFLRVAECCTVLRSRWYQIGIKVALTSASFL